jgi:hypothetical protein
MRGSAVRMGAGSTPTRTGDGPSAVSIGVLGSTAFSTISWSQAARLFRDDSQSMAGASCVATLCIEIGLGGIALVQCIGAARVPIRPQFISGTVLRYSLAAVVVLSLNPGWSPHDAATMPNRRSRTSPGAACLTPWRHIPSYIFSPMAKR